MKIKLVGMLEANVYGLGNVQRDQELTVSDELGQSLCAQVGMWEEIKTKKGNGE